MKKIFAIVVACLLVIGASKEFSSQTTAGSQVTSTYSTASKDTLRYIREFGLTGLSLSVYTADSSNITDVIVKRKVSGVFLTVQAGDTLIASDSSATAKLRVATLTLAPLADEYVFFVAFADTAGKTIKQSFDSTTVTYKINKQY